MLIQENPIQKIKTYPPKTLKVGNRKWKSNLFSRRKHSTHLLKIKPSQQITNETQHSNKIKYNLKRITHMNKHYESDFKNFRNGQTEGRYEIEVDQT